MLPVRDEHGNLAGFIGRARPGSGPEVPKYLNIPGTGTYKKGNLLFGLYEARDRLARDAVPVIAEGPSDAIAVTLAGQGRYAGLAPCGTALTGPQAEALNPLLIFARPGILVAFDDDPAGRKAAVRAYHLLRATSNRLQMVALSGKDPAEILQADGAGTLLAALQDRVQPLSALVIGAHLGPWERLLGDPEGPLLAMRSVAMVIADLLPAEAASAIRRITANRELTTTDEHMQPVAVSMLTGGSFPRPPPTALRVSAEPTTARTSRTNSHPRSQSKRLPSS